jgi:hypothetical protein
VARTLPDFPSIPRWPEPPSSAKHIWGDGRLAFGICSAPSALMSRVKHMQSRKSSPVSFVRTAEHNAFNSPIEFHNSIPIHEKSSEETSQTIVPTPRSQGCHILIEKDTVGQDNHHDGVTTGSGMNAGIQVELVSPEEMAILESAIQTAAVAHSRATAVRRAAASARSGNLWSMRSRSTLASEAWGEAEHVPDNRSPCSIGLCTPARLPTFRTITRSNSDSPYARRVYDIHSERWLPTSGQEILTSSLECGRNCGRNSETSSLDCNSMAGSTTNQQSHPSPLKKYISAESNIQVSSDVADQEAPHWHGIASVANCQDKPANFSRFSNWISPAFGTADSHQIVCAESSAARRPFSISRSDLETATIIGQAHNKFILCLCHHVITGSNMAGPYVVLVDQHAADERIRLEAMEDMLLNVQREQSCKKGAQNKSSSCHSKTHNTGISEVTTSRVGRNGIELWEVVQVPLRPPALVEGLDSESFQLLQRYRHAVESWGFQVQVM